MSESLVRCVRVATRTWPREMGAWSRKARRWGVERRTCAKGGEGVVEVKGDVVGEVGEVVGDGLGGGGEVAVGSGGMREVGVEGG